MIILTFSRSFIFTFSQKFLAKEIFAKAYHKRNKIFRLGMATSVIFSNLKFQQKFHYTISRNGEKTIKYLLSLQVVKFWDWQMLPVNDAVDSTEKDGSSFIMKDDHHWRLNKDIEKQRGKNNKYVIIYGSVCWTAGLGRGELGWKCCM